MRKQYFIRPTVTGNEIWDVDRLVSLSQGLPVTTVPVARIGELDECHWFVDARDSPTCRRIAQHAALIQEADLDYPVILSATGRVMDGMHRIAKAWLLGLSEIRAVRFIEDPPPDFTNRDPATLPYE